MSDSQSVGSTEMNHDHYPFPSEIGTVEVTNVNHLPVETNSGHDHFASEIGTVEVANVSELPVEMNYGHKLSVSVNTLMKETYELKQEHCRFAYDLVEKVLEIRGELNLDIPHNLPDPPCFLFTEEHATMVNNLLETKYRDTTNLLREIYRLTNGKYDYENYINCRDYFVEYWRRGAYTEKSFICACAVIAYTAAHFIQVNFNCGALDDVVMYIASWIAIVLGRGTIDNSSW